MKKVMIICALMISAVTFTKAQGGGQGGQNATPEARATAAFERQSVAALNLTAEQKTKATPILIAYFKASTELTTKAMADGADRQAAMTAIAPKALALREENEKAILAAIALTADQKKAYDAALATAKERTPTATTVIISGGGGFGGGRGQGGQGGGGGAQGGAPRPAGQ